MQDPILRQPTSTAACAMIGRLRRACRCRTPPGCKPPLCRLISELHRLASQRVHHLWARPVFSKHAKLSASHINAGAVRCWIDRSSTALFSNMSPGDPCGRMVYTSTSPVARIRPPATSSQYGAHSTLGKALAATLHNTTSLATVDDTRLAAVPFFTPRNR